MNIRIATIQDREAVQMIHLRAFPEGESEHVSSLAIDLLSEKTTPETISLIAESNGEIVGHLAFSPVKTENNEKFRGYILAPLGVKPEYQGRGIGSRLIDHARQQLSVMGVHLVFVYGDPKYYARFGFSVDAASRYTAPYKLHYPFGWQAMVLNECETEISPVGITCVSALCDPILW